MESLGGSFASLTSHTADSAKEIDSYGLGRFFQIALLFVFVFVTYICSPVVTSLDSHWVIPTALSLERHGTARIDAYMRRYPEAPWAASLSKEHFYSVYPIGVPIMVAPIVFLWDRAEALFGIDLEARVIARAPYSFELVIASLYTALAAALLFYYCLKKLVLSQAVLMALLFAFGTSAYSSASRGLWQHGPAMFLFMVIILLYERLPNWKSRGAIALGIIAGYSFAVRPSNGIIIIGFAVLVGWLSLRWLIWYSCGAVIAIAPLIWFHLAVYGHVLSPYYDLVSHASAGLLPIKPLMGTLFSPSRGLFIFSPFLLFVLFRLRPSLRRSDPWSALEGWLAMLSLAYWVGTSRTPFWWGGGSIGPRLLCEALPCLLILLIPVVRHFSFSTLGGTISTSVFALFCILSIAIHFRCAVDTEVLIWNAKPVNVDTATYRLWQWEDPQFLRGFLP